MKEETEKSIELEAHRIAKYLNKLSDEDVSAYELFLSLLLFEIDLNAYEEVGLLESLKFQLVITCNSDEDGEDEI